MRIWVMTAVMYVTLVIGVYSLVTGENPFVSGNHGSDIEVEHGQGDH